MMPLAARRQCKIIAINGYLSAAELLVDELGDEWPEQAALCRGILAKMGELDKALAHLLAEGHKHVKAINQEHE